MIKENLTIICSHQFGHNNASYYYCMYLKKYYSISYICWDHKLPRMSMDEVEISHVCIESSFLVRTFRFVKEILSRIQDRRTIIIVMLPFRFVPLLIRFFYPFNFIVYDIRTGSVSKEINTRNRQDKILRFESLFYKNITIISDSLAKKLAIRRKTHILPVGANIISSRNKTMNYFHLLYVGTLLNRNIEKTIDGFKEFYAEFHHEISIKYTIVGSSPGNEEDQLKAIIKKHNLDHVINVTGHIPHNKLTCYFDSANIGVSYIPITDYFDVQPPTKTHEYLLSGMPVIATSTSENIKLINDKNGVLIGDSAKEFHFGLTKIYNARKMFNSKEIRNSNLDFTWEKIVLNNLKNYIIKT